MRVFAEAGDCAGRDGRRTLGGAALCGAGVGTRGRLAAHGAAVCANRFRHGAVFFHAGAAGLPAAPL